MEIINYIAYDNDMCCIHTWRQMRLRALSSHTGPAILRDHLVGASLLVGMTWDWRYSRRRLCDNRWWWWWYVGVNNRHKRFQLLRPHHLGAWTITVHSSYIIRLTIALSEDNNSIKTEWMRIRFKTFSNQTVKVGLKSLNLNQYQETFFEIEHI